LKIRLVIFVLTLISLRVSAIKGTPEDSLLRLYRNEKADTLKIDIAGKLYGVYMRKNDFAKGKEYVDTMQLLALRNGDPKSMSSFFQYKAHYFYRTNHFDSAVFYDTKSIEIAQKNNYYIPLIRCNVNLGNIYNQRAEYSKAILCFQKAEQYATLIKDTAGLLNTAVNLGNIFYWINDYRQAKSKFMQVARIARLTPKYKMELSNAYNNIATVYLNETPKQPDSAMYYYREYLDLSIQIGSTNNIALALFNIAETQRITGDLKEAEINYNKSQKMYEESEDTVNMMKVMAGKGELYLAQNKSQEALAIFKQGLQYSYEYHMTTNTADFLKAISAAYLSMKNYKEAYEYFKEGTLLNDSILNEDNSKILYDLQTRYETAEKDKQNKLLEAENLLSHETIRQQQLITYFIIGGLVLAMLLAFFIFRGLTQQRKANAIISEQKQEVQHQKEIVEEKQKEILDSIHYAKRIQDGLLEQEDVLKANVKDSFTLFCPKDIVSGDFYWAHRKDDLFYLAVCDSTGHGVPGAFMSLLNVGFLNEAINERSLKKPNEIFDYVRERLIGSISKEGQKDGFDGILICLDHTTKEISYAAANNAPMLISSGKMTEQQKNKMPVGKGERTDTFDLFRIEWKDGDLLYLYTDGYADQFGMSEKDWMNLDRVAFAQNPMAQGKKFKYKQLNELLLANHALPLNQQAAMLDQKLSEWKGDLEQIDDICIIGIIL
jgi:serine phosphatase RsbU (regulator of sigma subunit)